MAAFERALEIDPRSVDARIGLATALGRSVADGWSKAVQQDVARGEQLLLEALADANSASAHAEMGRLRRLPDPKIKEHQGRIVKTTGDGLLLEFASVIATRNLAFFAGKFDVTSPYGVTIPTLKDFKSQAPQAR